MSVTNLPKDLESQTITQISKLSTVSKLQHVVNSHPNNLQKWNQLFTELNKLIDTIATTNNSNDINSDDNDLKQDIHNSYKALLSRFPYLTEYWKKWQLVELKINGETASQDILRMAVENYPNSISLWTQYLSSTLTHDKDKTDTELFRNAYKQALIHNGYDFNSHPIWDMAIEFETNQLKQSKELLELYLRIIKIPLYQYAQYYNQFSEINKQFEIQQIITSSDQLNQYVNEFGKNHLDDLSLLEKHQIIDDFTASIFSNTQSRVNKNWQFESLLETQEFTLEIGISNNNNNNNNIAKEKPIWINYLHQEIDTYAKKPNNDQFELVCTLFQRCLIPNCYDSEIWLKYLDFINNLSLSKQEKFDKQQEIYININAKLIPLDNNETRLKYVELLIDYEKNQEANEYLFSWMKLFSGGSKKYYKASYLEITKELFNLWIKLLDDEQFITIAESMINKYFNIHEKQPRKEKDEGTANNNNNNTTPNSESKLKLELTDSLITLVISFLNDESICILTVLYLKQLQHQQLQLQLQLETKQSQTIKIRKFFNKFNHEKCFKTSIQFWNFYFQFELTQNHWKNLKSLINHIKFNTQLPKIIIDSFIEWMYEISNDNLINFLKLNDGRSDETIIMKDLEISNSLYYNKTTIKRHAMKNNYIIINNNNNNNSNNSFDKKRNNISGEEEFLRLTSKQIGHPGIFVDAVPQITNRLMLDGNDIDLTQENLSIPPLPMFKNVEKASQPIKYPSTTTTTITQTR